MEYYDNLQNEVLRVTQRGGQQTGVAEDLGGEPLSLEELAARFASENKVTPESLKGETGMSGKELKGFVGLVAREENGGVSIERLGELLARSDEWAQLGGTPEMTQDARNMLIDAYMSGNPRSYVKQQRERFAQREAEHEMNDIENFAQAAFGMSAEEYLAYEEQALPAIINKYAGFDFDIYYAILQEQADARASEAEANNDNPINGNTYEQQGESNGNGGSGGILQEEWTADEQGERTSDEPEAGGQGSVGNAGLQGVGTQGNVGEDTPELVGEKYKLSEKKAGNGEPFYQNENGDIDLADIPQDVFDKIGYKRAPLRLIPSMVAHMIARHGKSTGAVDVDKAISFILDVMNNFDHVRLGYNGALIFSIENGRNKTGRRAVTILLSSNSGEFYGVSSSGYEGIDKLKKRPELWAGSAVITPATDSATEPVTTLDAQQGGEQIGSASGQSGLNNEEKPASASSSDIETEPEGKRNGTATPQNGAISFGKVTEKDNSVQTSIANAEAETDTDPSEAQKKAGNYKKGHVKIDGFDVTIENPKGSMRRGTDEDGNQWEQEMPTPMATFSERRAWTATI